MQLDVGAREVELLGSRNITGSGPRSPARKTGHTLGHCGRADDLEPLGCVCSNASAGVRSDVSPASAPREGDADADRNGHAPGVRLRSWQRATYICSNG